MRHSALRAMRLFFAMIFIAAAVGSSRGGLVRAQVPAAPAGGLDASKLPDIEGIHLGMPIEQASAMMKSLFPAAGHRLTVTAGRFQNTSYKPWVSSMTGTLANGCASCQEEVVLRFSIPPNQQQVVAMQRNIVFEPGKQPMADATVAAMRQKYGPETLKTSDSGVQTSLTWLFDEQGQHLLATTPKFTPGCAGVVAEPPVGGMGFDSPLTVDFVLATAPITPNVLTALMAHPCRSHVYVRVDLASTGPGNALVRLIDIHMSENDLDTRGVVATQQYLDGVAAAGKQQELKKAQQQAAPKL